MMESKTNDQLVWKTTDNTAGFPITTQDAYQETKSLEIDVIDLQREVKELKDRESIHISLLISLETKINDLEKEVKEFAKYERRKIS